MVSMTVQLRNVVGTEAALGWAGSNTVVVDRPAGKAGGQGLGFNGGELLAMAIGGCLCNDLRYVAEEMGRPIAELSVSVTVEMQGTPQIAISATGRIDCKMVDSSSASPVIERAMEVTMVSNSVRRGFPVNIVGV